jgi:hypothetical protein
MEDTAREGATSKKPKSVTRIPHEACQLKVYHGGQNGQERKGNEQGNHTWNVGDIDIDPDGSIFIRNPYLANAIEDQLNANKKKRDDWDKGHRMGSDPDAKPFLFRLTRDEGWSGEKQNLVC